MKYLNAICAEIKISLESTWSYKMNFISDILFIGGLYIALLFMNTGTSLGTYYGSPEESKSLLLIGYILWSFSILAINLVSSNIEAEATRGTLEQKLTSIIPLYILMIGRLISGMLIELVELAIILISSVLIFHVGISVNLKAIIILLITIAGMYGMGLMFGGLTLKFKNIGRIMYIIQTLLLFVSNTLTVVSDKFSIINLIPLTTGNDLIRKALVGQVIPLSNYLTLATISLVWLATGILTFNYFKKLSRVDGLVGSY
ncbi:ABC transporter permease [Clostridium sp.]